MEFVDQCGRGVKFVGEWGGGPSAALNAPPYSWHVQILNCVASLTNRLSQGPRGISCSRPDLGAQPQPLQAQPVEGPPPA